jgi:hypothetical protein
LRALPPSCSWESDTGGTILKTTTLTLGVFDLNADVG